MWRQNAKGEWIECGPYEPLPGSVVFDWAGPHVERYVQSECDLSSDSANRAAAMALIPKLMATMKRRQQDSDRGQTDLFSMFEAAQKQAA